MKIDLTVICSCGGSSQRNVGFGSKAEVVPTSGVFPGTHRAWFAVITEASAKVEMQPPLLL